MPSPPAPLRNKIPFSGSNILSGEGGDLRSASPPAPLRYTIPFSDSNILSGEGGCLVLEPLIAYARELRKHQTEAEEVLWQFLRNRKLNRFKFRRQHPVSEMYVLDFYCSKIKLAIELDGSHHMEKEQQEHDTERTHILKHLGIRVIRFTNAEALNNTEQVLKQILEICNASLPSPDENIFENS